MIICSLGRLLFARRNYICGQILCQICHGVTLYLHAGSRPWHSRGRGGVDPGSVVYEIRSKCGILNLMILHIPGQLVNECANHFQMAEFFNADVRKKGFELIKGH